MKKKCSGCKKEKAYSEFYKRITYGDGHTPQCKECMVKKQIATNKKAKEQNAWTKVFIG